MKVLVFDLCAPLAHFRRPDTTATHLTYPFVTGTALRGLLGAILGLDEFLDTGWTAIQLLGPVQTRAQELSLLGKGFLGGQSTFSRPTSIELVVEPHYRIYYTGDHMDKLASCIAERRSTYPTYLGSAFCLCVPKYQGIYDAEPIRPADGDVLEALTAVPTHVVKQLELQELNEENQYQLARANGLLYGYLGNREFSGTINLLYELRGQPIRFRVKANDTPIPVRFAGFQEGRVVALW